MANIGIFDGKSVKGPIDSGDGAKESYIGKSGWPRWANNPIPGQKVGPDAFSFSLDEDEMDYSESDGYLVNKSGDICHISMSNFGGSNFDSNMWFFLDLKQLLKFNSKFRINGLRGMPKNPKELFLLVQLCHVCHYASEIADSAEYDKDTWNKASDTLKELAVAVYTYHNGASYAKKLFPQGAKTIAESQDKVMSWKEIIESKIEEKIMARLQQEEDSEYQEFFQKALKKFGVKSPAELEGDEKKKEFFDYVDKNWKGDNEKAEDTEASDTLEPKKKKLAASNCGS